ncbi:MULTISPECIES: ATP-binding protein [Spirulina sp. CCY15215]|uniref:AAA family ATPase n=1 Tax=Spirulina sp. CCY15215 TaxID=2767591 RepID=UPI0019522F7B|nr:ATP-binding protein [Spirulina major]
MLDSLYIKNFRAFKTLEIDKLSNVNLIIGNNNSGKTCLLEALRVYATNASPLLLYNLISERGQDWEIRFKLNENLVFQDINHPFRYLFYGYKLPRINTESIEIGSLHNLENRIKLYLSLYQTIETDTESRFVKLDSPSETDISLVDTEYVLELETYRTTQRLVRLSKDIQNIRRYSRSISMSLSNHKSLHNIQFVPTDCISDDILAGLWNNVSIKPTMKQEVINALKLIDSDIQDISVLLPKELNRNSIPREKEEITPILIYNDDFRIPLKSLGDGITHLFHIVLALVNAQNGLLLIDEFENGLHYSVQSKLWDLIFQLSEKLNVQVVATTHSKDCINAFEEIWKKYPDRATFYRLDNYISETEVMPYDRDSLGDILAIDGEVR